jgi:hypothetical protein
MPLRKNGEWLYLRLFLCRVLDDFAGLFHILAETLNRITPAERTDFSFCFSP